MANWDNLELIAYETTSEINKKGIFFVATPYSYFKVTAASTEIAGSLFYKYADFKLWGTAAKTDGGNWSTLSDARIKNINKTFTSSINDLLKLQPYVFTYTKDGYSEVGEQIGLIAQEVEKHMPHLVSKEDYTFEDGETIKDLRTINSSSLIYTCINAIKELHNEINDLKEKLNKIENEKIN